MAAPGASRQQPGQSARKPNIVFILGDDLGHCDVGMYGCREIPTPNIDSIAAAGVKFTNGYVTAPVCSPSRAALMTGRYQHRLGFDLRRGLEAHPERARTCATSLQCGRHGQWRTAESHGRQTAKILAQCRNRATESGV
jgi:hypothetical protein